MCKKILILCFLGFSVLSVGQDFKGGLIGGINGSQIDGDYLGGFNKFGMNGGGFVLYDFNETLAGVMELRYIGRGKVKNADLESNDPTYFKISLHYVQLPLLVQIKTNTNFKFEAGFAIGYLLATKFYDEYGTLPNDYVGYEFNSFDYNIMAGVRYDINERWFANVRWSLSFIPAANIYDDTIYSPDYLYNAGSQFNRTLEFNLGYKFGTNR